MYLLREIPAPNNRIWAACYMDSATECFEIRTEFKDAPGSIQTLYHKEYPIGTALTVCRPKGVFRPSGADQGAS